MRVTVVVEDGAVGVDGDFYRVDMTGIPANVRALQWYDTHGEVEYSDGTPNEIIHSLADYQLLLDRWTVVRDTPPPPLVMPPLGFFVCSPWQIRKALNILGLRQTVEDAVAASTDITLKDGWEFASHFQSNDPFVISMGAALGKTEQETAELIQYAATL